MPPHARAIDDLPPLRDVIRRHGLSAKKSLGQNFLLDLNLTARIARAGGPLDGMTVVEVGRAPAGSPAPCSRRARAGDCDRARQRAITALGGNRGALPGRLDGDRGGRARRRHRAELDDGPARIVANLPYNIATALLVRWLSVEPWPPWYDLLVLMFQREVAERIVAVPGDKAYGRLAVLAGWRTEAKIMFDIAPSAFVPPPKVTFLGRASVAPRRRPALRPLHSGARYRGGFRAAAQDAAAKPTRARQRPAADLAAAGIDPTARAEEIPVDGFVALANGLDCVLSDGG